MTAVGGTHLDLKKDGTLNSEQAWDLPGTNWKDSGKAMASGGGESLFSRPDWQGGPASALPTWGSIAWFQMSPRTLIPLAG